MTSKNKRRRKKKGAKLKGILMEIEGKLQPVLFTVPCEFCESKETFPVRVPKPTGWHWTTNGELGFDVFYCCEKQPCIESAANIYRNALKEGIIVEGVPPQSLFPKDYTEE